MYLGGPFGRFHWTHCHHLKQCRVKAAVVERVLLRHPDAALLSEGSARKEQLYSILQIIAVL